tara:strand:+ start:532 stop:684 length:153 start_codon:yes stop_codon:yes gene_type:complete
MRYDDAIDLAFKLNNEKDSDAWRYSVEIDATSGVAKIAVIDDEYIKIGYL